MVTRTGRSGLLDGSRSLRAAFARATLAGVEFQSRQRSLFPEPFEVEADAPDALPELDVERGLDCVDSARREAPELPNLDELEGALGWLRRVSDDARVSLASAEGVARAFLMLPGAGLGRGDGPSSVAERLLASSQPGERASDFEHLCRFKLLFVLDRSRPPGTCNLDRREQMLEPELVARTLGVSSERERR